MVNYRLRAIHGIDRRVSKRAARAILARPFGIKAQCRVLIYGHAGPISRSQIEPFFHHSDAFKERYGAEFRCRPIDDLISGVETSADIVLVQPWFTVDGIALGTALERLRERLPRLRTH